MAKKVAGDRNLDFEGMKQAVRNAIDIYEREIAGGRHRPISTLSSIEALARARSLVDAGKSGLARATLRRAAEAMRREEEERRERYVAGVTVLYNRERDIALAAYDGEAAAEAIVRLGRSHPRGECRDGRPVLNSEAETLYEYGRDRGSNVHLIAADRSAAEMLDAASSDDERGSSARTISATRSATLGERESGTARLEEAVAAYRAALEERTPRAGAARLGDDAEQSRQCACEARGAGERDGAAGGGGRGLSRGAEGTDARAGAARLGDDAEQPRQRALERSGERESGTARLEEAVAAYRAALEERTRERVPLDWAMTQNNLGNALWTLGERESGTARLEEAVAAYRAALEERTRERVPLDWAMTQNNLGNALVSARRAGERDGAAGGGGRGLSRGAGGTDARAGAARLGDDAEQPRQRALDARRAGERDGAAGGGGRGLSRGAGGTDARAGAARLGDDAEQPRQRASDARRAGERDGAAGGGGRGLSRGAGGMDARAGAARLGDDAEQPRQRAPERSASGRAGRRGWRRRSRPIARRWRNGRASGCRSTGR